MNQIGHLLMGALRTKQLKLAAYPLTLVSLAKPGAIQMEKKGSDL